MLLYCHLLPAFFPVGRVEKTAIFSLLLCFTSVRAYNRRPDLTMCNCKQPSCLDERVCMTVKWIRFRLKLIPTFSLKLPVLVSSL